MHFVPIQHVHVTACEEHVGIKLSAQGLSSIRNDFTVQMVSCKVAFDKKFGENSLAGGACTS